MKLKYFFNVNEQSSQTGQTITTDSKTGVTITFYDKTNLNSIYELFKSDGTLKVEPNDWNITQVNNKRKITGSENSINKFITLYNQKYPNQKTSLNLDFLKSDQNTSTSSQTQTPSKGDLFIKNTLLSGLNKTNESLEKEIIKIKKLL